MVSVIIPVYNAEMFITRCLESIIGQTYQEIEIILVNDGSKDNSLSILREYESGDNRIKVLSQENKGVAAARNIGLRSASGDFILYVDSDDWIEPNMIARLLELADGADIVFCGNDNADIPEQAKLTEKTEIETWDQQRQLLEFMKHKRMTGMLWNKLIRRSSTNGCHFNEKTGFGEDAEFLWQVLQNSRKMVVTNEILYHHTLEETSISHLSFSDKKYSAIPMWEAINGDVEKNYPELLTLARERLTCTAVFSLFEIKHSEYHNKENIRHMRTIARDNIVSFLKSQNVSKKFKLYAVAVCLGY